MQTRDEAAKQLEVSKKSGEEQWNAAQKQFQKATPSNQKASKKTWDLAQKARDEVGKIQLCLQSFSLICLELLATGWYQLHCRQWILGCLSCMLTKLIGDVSATSTLMLSWHVTRHDATFSCGMQANKRLSQAEKELAKAFDHARSVAEKRSQKQEL